MTVSTPPTRNCVKGEFGVSRLSTPPNLILGVANFKEVDYSSLREGQQVEFEVGQGRNGRPEAVSVKLAP